MFRKFKATEILLIVLSVVLVVLTFLVAIVIMYPKAGDRAVRNIRDSFEEAFGYDIQEKATDFFVKIGERAKAGWEKRVKRIPESLTRFYKVSPGDRKKQEKEKLVEIKDEEFNKCSKCHKDFVDRLVFNKIYLDHRLHEAEEIRCDECHIDISHKPKPDPVRENICVSCHKDTKIAKLSECSVCHAPGSIYSGGIIDKSRLSKFAASKNVKLLMPGGFEHGKTPQKCNNCHDLPDFCNDCHLVFHDKISSWTTIHGANILSGKYNIKGCKECHRSTWCSKKCHPNPGRQAREAILPLPIVPLGE